MQGSRLDLAPRGGRVGARSRALLTPLPPLWLAACGPPGGRGEGRFSLDGRLGPGFQLRGTVQPWPFWGGSLRPLPAEEGLLFLRSWSGVGRSRGRPWAHVPSVRRGRVSSRPTPGRGGGGRGLVNPCPQGAQKTVVFSGHFPSSSFVCSVGQSSLGKGDPAQLTEQSWVGGGLGSAESLLLCLLLFPVTPGAGGGEGALGCPGPGRVARG